jgi:hypothetical protein
MDNQVRELAGVLSIDEEIKMANFPRRRSCLQDSCSECARKDGLRIRMHVVHDVHCNFDLVQWTLP